MKLNLFESSAWVNQSLAATVELGIHNEAALRRMLDAQETLWAVTTGLETSSVRRRRREAAEFRELHPEVGRWHGIGHPTVNWHEGGAGPALLLLNGWTASGLVWPQSWVRRLEENYRVIRVDNRGTGWSRTAPHPFTVADLADDARNVLRACGVEHATVLGVSMGGMVAQELAARHGELVDRLVLVASRPPVPAWVGSDGDARLTMMKTPAGGEDLREFFIALWGRLTGPGFAERHPDVIAEVADQVLARVTPRVTVISQARAIWCWHGKSRIRRIDAPTTVVHGDRDSVIPVGNGMRLARLIPNADYVELPGVGHLVPQEAGDDLLKVLGCAAGPVPVATG